MRNLRAQRCRAQTFMLTFLQRLFTFTVCMSQTLDSSLIIHCTCVAFSAETPGQTLKHRTRLDQRKASAE